MKHASRTLRELGIRQDAPIWIRQSATRIRQGGQFCSAEEDRILSVRAAAPHSVQLRLMCGVVESIQSCEVRFVNPTVE